MAATYSRSTDAFSGNYAQNLTQAVATDQASILSRPIGVKSGIQYNVRCRVKANAANVGSLYFQVYWFTDSFNLSFGSSTYISTSTIVSANKNVGTAWTLFDAVALGVPVTAPANANFGCIVLINAGDATAPGTLTFDTVSWALAQINNPIPSSALTTGCSTSSTTYSDIPEMSVTKTFSGGDVELVFSAWVFSNSNSNDYFFSFFRDGVQIGPEYVFSDNRDTTIAFTHIDTVALGATSGSHTYSVGWRVANGATTLSNSGISREFQAEELV